MNIMVKKELAKKLNLKTVVPEYKTYKYDITSVTSYFLSKLFVKRTEESK